MSLKLVFIPAFLLIMAPFVAIAQTPSPTPPDTAELESPLEYKVVYDAVDSIRFDLENQKVYLFGNAFIEYDNIRLDAGFITYDFTESLVQAYAATDSAGNPVGRPVFKEDQSEFTADTIRYNFDSKRGIIKNVRTQEGEGYLHSEVTKKQANDHVHLSNGHYTTCNLEHPHYAFKLGQAIVVPNDKILARNINLQVAEIPTPVWLPFAYFPNKKGEAAGILIPTYGESPTLGFFLLNGGYYWPLGDKMDTRLTGDIYSRGSWGLKNLTNYKVRYRYNGSINLSYNILKRSDPEFPDFTKSSEFFVRWSHNQDAKARPNSRFSANVNAGSSTNFQNNFNSNINDYLTNTFQSNISYSRSFAGKPYTLNINLRHNQNTLTRQVNLTLPEAAFNVSRFYPGKTLRKWIDKSGTATRKWYENIGVAYSTNFRNDLDVGDSVLSLNNFSNLADSMRMGMRHNVAITTSITPERLPFTLTPSFNATERWYVETLNREWDNDLQQVVSDTINGFDRNLEWNASAALNTKLYSFFTWKNGVKIRHVLTPNLSFLYRPDFGTNEVIFTNQNNPITYNPYSLGVYGVPVSGESGMVALNLLNNLEAKVKSAKDTVTGMKKVSIIENLSFNTSYDLFKDVNRWANVGMNGRTRLFKKLNLNYTAVYDPYDYDSLGIRIDDSYWTRENGLGGISSASLAASTSLRSPQQGNLGNQGDDDPENRELAQIRANPDAYVDFNVPWTLQLSYNLRVNRILTAGVDSFALTQTVNFSGDFNLTEKWKIGFSSGYDFINKGLTNNTSVNIYRDLHCWELSFNYIPFGFQQSYNIQLNVKSAMLQDLKLARRRSWFDNQPN